MKQIEVRYLNKRLPVILDDDDNVDGLKLYINNIGGTLRVMYVDDERNQCRLDKRLRGFSCVPSNDNSLDLRAENNAPLDRAKLFRERPAWGETGQKGITRRKTDGKFVATYCIKSKTKFITACDTLDAAVKARTLKLKELGIE